MMRQTSIMAFMSIRKKLVGKQEEVYMALKQLAHSNPHSTGFTDREICQYLRRTINTITPRRNELVRLGIVAQVGTINDPITRRRAILWRALEVY